MTCPLCGTGILPGKICLHCGFDPSRPDVRPTGKPDIGSVAREASERAGERKGAKAKKSPGSSGRFQALDEDDILAEIDRMGQTPAASRKSAGQQATAPFAPESHAAAPPRKSTLQQASVPVTTQFSFEGRPIVGYAGLVASTVVVRVGGPDELLPEGQDMQRLSGGPIGLRLRKAIDLAIADLKTEAIERGGTAVVGARLEVLPGQGPLAIVTLIGTAVVLEP
jgi:uncharacterized protein YbjQ (UPF0145 family)